MSHEQLGSPDSRLTSGSEPGRENIYSRQAKRNDSMRAEWEAYLRGEFTPEEAKFKFNHQAHKYNPPNPKLHLKSRILSPGEEVTLVELPDGAA